MDHPARRTRRQKIFQPFILVGPRGERRAHLLDISENGALIHCDPSCDKGALVQIKLPDRSLGAKVAWSASPHFGVIFAQPLSANALSALLQAKAL
ncbi:PilZ domain-containing protein [Sphingomonas vulcanisoli]|uniref:PilZ domain-containing protein n=1 Tax=Sphingomonas vulcanisoli TaxID=1658060 RepID=UPI00141F267D